MLDVGKESGLPPYLEQKSKTAHLRRQARRCLDALHEFETASTGVFGALDRWNPSEYALKEGEWSWELELLYIESLLVTNLYRVREQLRKRGITSPLASLAPADQEKSLL